MNTCTYEYKDYKNGSISECTFREDDLNEINWFFESDNQPTSVVSVKINGQKVSLNEARYVVYQWEQKLLWSMEILIRKCMTTTLNLKLKE